MTGKLHGSEKENELIKMLARRDERGTEELLLRYGPLMRYIISPVLPDPRDQQECLSEAALRVWDRIHFFDPELGSFTGWLTAVTRNTALNYARKNRKAEDSLQEIPPDYPSREPGPEEILIQKEYRKVLKRALLALSQKERILFYRKYYYRQTTAQIASELGMTERAVEGRLYRMKKKLKNQIKEKTGGVSDDR